MLDLNKCQLIDTRVANLLSTISVVDEGTPMVLTLENGVEAVKPCNGAAAEQFAGVVISRSTTPLQTSFIERLTIPSGAPYTVALSKTMVGSAIGVAVANADGTYTALVAGTPASNATDYSISGGVITVNVAQAGKTLQVSYRYAPTMAEAVMRYAFNAFAPVAISLPTIGLVTEGEIFTDCFDPASNWAGYTGATPLKLGAGGIFTLTGSGVVIDQVTVSQVPGVDSPMLGLRLHGGF